MGNNIFTRFENPMGIIIRLVMQSNFEKSLNFFSFFEMLFRRLIPAEIAVVNMAIKITMPYRLWYFVNLFFIT